MHVRAPAIRAGIQARSCTELRENRRLAQCVRSDRVMSGRHLWPDTYRRLGGPLPHLLAPRRPPRGYGRVTHACHASLRFWEIARWPIARTCLCLAQGTVARGDTFNGMDHVATHSHVHPLRDVHAFTHGRFETRSSRLRSLACRSHIPHVRAGKGPFIASRRPATGDPVRSHLPAREICARLTGVLTGMRSRIPRFGAHGSRHRDIAHCSVDKKGFRPPQLRFTVPASQQRPRPAHFTCPGVRPVGDVRAVRVLRPPLRSFAPVGAFAASW